MSDNSALFEKKLKMAQEELRNLEHERKRLKWLLVAAMTLWPIGLYFSPIYSILISAAFVALFCVGNYISFFHRKEARKKIQDLSKRLDL